MLYVQLGKSDTGYQWMEPIKEFYKIDDHRYLTTDLKDREFVYDKVFTADSNKAVARFGRIVKFKSEDIMEVS